jgi:hypothetical protein
MGAKLLFVITACFICAGARAQQDAGGIPHEPKTIFTLASPDSQLVAIARSPIPDTMLPDYEDADGTLVFIRGPNRGDHVISHRFFPGRFISKMVWSPDSQFLVLCSESAGGHSPWHFNSYFWSRNDRKFRSVDFCAGPVVSDEFTFAAPHSLTVKIAPTAPDNTLDLDHPVDKTVNLSEIRRNTPPLQPSPWP